jgi:8-oxo-dGTP pyrophosphatase MutT (NUDIX family)
MMQEKLPFKRQAAAVPFRILDDGRIEILLIRRKDKSWGIPKGGVDPGRTLRDTALNEAAEEAGIHGELLDEPLGDFVYQKQKGELLVTVYAMRVTQVDEYWLEQPVRERSWFSIEEALTLIGRMQIQPMIAKLGRILQTKDLPSS